MPCSHILKYKKEYQNQKKFHQNYRNKYKHKISDMTDPRDGFKFCYFEGKKMPVETKKKKKNVKTPKTCPKA
jgi:hypothetical protein